MEAGLAIWGGQNILPYIIGLLGPFRKIWEYAKEISGNSLGTFIAMNQLAVKITRQSLSFGCICINSSTCSNSYWVKLWVIWINSDFEFQYIRLIIRYWFCSTIHYLGDEIYSGARLQVLATGWVSPTVLRERSLESKTHVDRYEQYQSFSVNYRPYCHFRFDIFALIIEIIRVKYVRL